MSKSKVLIPVVHKGTLSQYGYSLSTSKTNRRKALQHAVTKYGYSKVMKKVNLLYIYNMNKHPSLAKKVQGDKKFLMEHYAQHSKSSRKSTRKSRSKSSSKSSRKSSRKSTRKSTRKSRRLRMSAKW